MVTADDQLTANKDSHFIKPLTNMGHGASYPNTPTVSLSIKQSTHTPASRELSKREKKIFLKF
jgi:hypothetical protein